MEMFLATFIIMVIAVLGMAIGVLLGRSPIKGSCGGLNSIDGLECDICTKPCEKKQQAMQRATE
jgi:hypothetical protein